MAARGTRARGASGTAFACVLLLLGTWGPEMGPVGTEAGVDRMPDQVILMMCHYVLQRTLLVGLRSTFSMLMPPVLVLIFTSPRNAPRLFRRRSG